MKPIFLKPYLQEKIWGGDKLKTEFGMNLPSETVGEAWVASAHPNGLSTVIYPEELSGKTLDALYKENLDLFGSKQPDVFPLLVKILDAKDDLSVQVHPDDAYAQAYEGPKEYGKNECWYIISAEEDAKIIYGHHATNKEEFIEKIKADDFEGLFREIPVEAGDFFDVPAGTIHAIGAGVMILETQQSSDTTYRVYDYNRKDKEGKTRELHLEKAADVTIYPHSDSKNNIKGTNQTENFFHTLVSNNFFVVEKAKIREEKKINLESKYYIVTAVEGKGAVTLDNKVYEITKGDAFILPYGEKEIVLNGEIELIFSSTN